MCFGSLCHFVVYFATFSFVFFFFFLLLLPLASYFMLLPVYCWVNILVIFINFLLLLLLCLLSFFFSPLFTSLPFSSPLWLHIYSACSIARISLDLGNSLLFGHSLHALRESVIERHFERGGGGGKGSEHLLHVTLLPACNIVACNSLLLLLLLLTMLFVWLGLQMLQRATIK